MLHLSVLQHAIDVFAAPRFMDPLTQSAAQSLAFTLALTPPKNRNYSEKTCSTHCFDGKYIYKCQKCGIFYFKY